MNDYGSPSLDARHVLDLVRRYGGEVAVMTLKPPTRTLPKLVMKEWPEVTPEQVAQIDKLVAPEFAGGGWVDVESLSDFTLVVEETGIFHIVDETPSK